MIANPAWPGEAFSLAKYRMPTPVTLALKGVRVTRR